MNPIGSEMLTWTHGEVQVALSGSPREEGWAVVLYAPWCPYCQAMEEAYDDVARQLAGSGVRVGKFRVCR